MLQEQKKLSGGKAQGRCPSDCWDGRLRAHAVSGAVGKGNEVCQGIDCAGLVLVLVTVQVGGA
jgi:hypothetical protein